MNQRGTTITLHNLFQPLPVRRKEFERHAKKEFAKTMAMLNAYALVPCAGGWDDEHEADSQEGSRKGVRLIVDAVGKNG